MAMYREMDMGFWLERGEAEMTNSGHMEARLRPIAKILGQTGDSAIASDIFHIFR
jgi:hypothetical protein